MKTGIKKLDEASAHTQAAVVFTLGFVLLVGTCFLPKSPEDVAAGRAKETARAERNHEITATVVCERAIKDALRSPSTADFPWLPDGVGRLVNDNDIMRVLTYVDAQNGFGATVRTRFKCDCKQIDEKWVVVDLKTVGG